MAEDTIVLAGGLLATVHGKVTHGLLRSGERFRVRVVVDHVSAGRDAGELLDGQHRGIPVVSTLAEALERAPDAKWCVVGMATHGGRLPEDVLELLRVAARAGLGIVNGLHDAAGADEALSEAVRESGAAVVDVRHRQRARRFWDGSVLDVRAARVAVLGTDCALGKRTTTRLLLQACREAGIATEMIYTGQTGWMQGGEYGIVLDSIVNDFVSGELEGEIVRCDREREPQLMLLEGQSSLRNPSGPCGGELLVSAGAKGAILQHAPGRKYFEGFEERELRIPPLEEEVELVRLYGAEVLGLALNGEELDPPALRAERERWSADLGLPVVLPLEDGVAPLVSALRRFVDSEARR